MAVPGTLWTAFLAMICLTNILPFREHLRIVHHVPGRIRLRAATGLFSMAPVDPAAVIRELTALPGIRAVRLNAPALSLVIEYDRARIPDDAWRDIIHGTPAEADAAIGRLGWRG